MNGFFKKDIFAIGGATFGFSKDYSRREYYTLV
jgi:hypothetical protein